MCHFHSKLNHGIKKGTDLNILIHSYPLFPLNVLFHDSKEALCVNFKDIGVFWVIFNRAISIFYYYRVTFYTINTSSLYWILITHTNSRNALGVRLYFFWLQVQNSHRTSFDLRKKGHFGSPFKIISIRGRYTLLYTYY